MSQLVNTGPGPWVEGIGRTLPQRDYGIDLGKKEKDVNLKKTLSKSKVLETHY